MMQRFMTLVVTTMTNGAGFKSAPTVPQVVEQSSSEWNNSPRRGRSLHPARIRSGA